MWRSMNEKPEEGMECLLSFTSSIEALREPYVLQMKWKNGEWENLFEDDIYTPYAWMPLPNPAPLSMFQTEG